MAAKMTAARKRALRLERKVLDRAVLRLTRSFWDGQETLTAHEQHELLGLVKARRRLK